MLPKHTCIFPTTRSSWVFFVSVLKSVRYLYINKTPSHFGFTISSCDPLTISGKVNFLLTVTVLSIPATLTGSIEFNSFGCNRSFLTSNSESFSRIGSRLEPFTIELGRELVAEDLLEAVFSSCLLILFVMLNLGRAALSSSKKWEWKSFYAYKILDNESEDIEMVLLALRLFL